MTFWEVQKVVSFYAPPYPTTTSFGGEGPITVSEPLGGAMTPWPTLASPMVMNTLALNNPKSKSQQNNYNQEV